MSPCNQIAIAASPRPGLHPQIARLRRSSPLRQHTIVWLAAILGCGIPLMSRPGSLSAGPPVELRDASDRLESGDDTTGTAEEDSRDDPTLSPLSISPDQARESFQWLATLATGQIPEVIEGDKGWGNTKKVWAGVKFGNDGLRITTHRRYRDRRHGRWTRYRLTPAPRDSASQPPAGVRVTVNRVQPLGGSRWQIDTTIRAPLAFDARVERWNLGVQWYSLSAEGELEVRVDATAVVGFYADYADIPPAFVVDPEITAAKIELERLRVRRISKLGRDVAKNLSDLMKTLIDETWVKKENGRLVGRLNEKIDRKRDDLRWSLQPDRDEEGFVAVPGTDGGAEVQPVVDDDGASE